MSRPLYTIGYEGIRSVDLFDRLLGSGVNTLIDIRDVPISRKRGFSKNALRDGLSEHGIQYLHLKGLGDPKPGRLAARDGRYSDFRRIFKTHMRSSAAQQSLAQAVICASSRVACLLCFEEDHTNCHRCIVADDMRRAGRFAIVHLKIDQPGRSISNSYRRDRQSSIIG